MRGAGWGLGERIAAGAFLLAAGASALLAVMPVYSSGETLAQVNGSGVYGTLLLPPALAAFPLVWRQPRARAAAAVLLTVWVGLAGFSIGLFYAPAAVVMVLSALSGRSDVDRQTDRHAGD